MAETGSDTRSGIGARLRASREKMGLTQLQAAEKLHVDAKVVDSLEIERWDALGAPVFVRGHLKHYAELIGEPAGELLDIYAAATKPVAPDLTRLPKVRPASNPSRLAVPALVVLIGFVLLGVVWWVVKSVSGPESEKPKRGPQPVVIAPEVSRDPDVIEVPTSSAPPANSAPVTAGTRNAAPRAPGTNTQAGTAAPPAAAAAASATPAPARAGKPMEVTLRFAADSWVEVYDANGEKLFYDVGTADSSRTVSGTPPFRVHVANARKGDEAQFTINRAGRIVRAPPKADGG